MWWRKGLLAIVVAVCSVALSLDVADARAAETVYACAATPNIPNSVFYESDQTGMEEAQNCNGSTGVMGIYANSKAPYNSDSYWATVAPAGLLITQASVSMVVNGLNNGSPYGGGFFWGASAANGLPVGTGQTGATYSGTGFPTSEFGFQMVCESTSGCSNAGENFRVSNVALTVGETYGPTLGSGGLWNASGWVRGTWPMSVSGTSPSGVCSLSAAITGDPQTIRTSETPNENVYQQCGESLSGSFDTTYASNGADTLNIADSDAAGLSAGASETVKIDNSTPSVSLSTPGTALSTAGTQYVTATTNTGPSGAYGAECSVDGGSPTFYAGATARIPVSGVGQHTVTCTGLNNAMSSSGQRASSAPVSASLDIQQPTEAAITFSKLADALKCRTVVERVRKLGKPRTITLHGHRVQVRRYHEVTRHVRRCRARTEKRTVLVELRRHGKLVRRHGHVVRVRRVRRVVLLPHRIHRTLRRVPHGRGTTVSGVLLLADGTPLAGQTVTVLGAPNTGAPQFSPISTATTNADGFWVAKIPRGPSRLLEAQYAGNAADAAANSTIARTIVPARIRILSATPRVAWGRTATFTGRVYGGDIPRGGINIRLRYGYRSQSVTYGVKTHVGPRGRFRTTFTFGPGNPRDVLRFHFQFATLPGGGYPYHTATSNSVIVRVGGHPRPVGHHRRHRHRRRS